MLPRAGIRALMCAANSAWDEKSFISNENALFPTFYPKITSGEILAKEAAEERIWAEQTLRRQLRAPDAPKVKHDRMKQFYTRQDETILHG